MSFLFCSQREYSTIGNQLFTKGNVGAETGKNFNVFFDKYSLIGRKAVFDGGTYVDDIDDFILVESYIDIFMDVLSINSKIRDKINNSNNIVIRAGGIASLIAFLCIVLNRKYHLEIGGCVFNSLWFHGSKSGKFIAPFSYILRLFLIYNAKSVQCVSNFYLQNRYFMKYLNKNNIGISNVRIDRKDFRLVSKSNIKINSKKIRITYIASFKSSFKGHLEAIDFLCFANRLGNNYHINFIGVGDYSHLKKYAMLRGCNHNINFFDPIDNGEIISWLTKYSDIYIQFSKREGLSRALLEAMSQSIPVLATDVGATSEVVPPKQLITLSNFDTIVDKINHIFSSDDIFLSFCNISYEKSMNYNSEYLIKKFKIFWENSFENRKLC